MNHVCESLNHASWECKYHIGFVRPALNLEGRQDV